MSLNGGPSPPDFNVYIDPLAAAVLLHAAAAAGVQLVLLHWTLTSLGTTKGQNIVVDSSMIRCTGRDAPNSAQPRYARGFCFVVMMSLTDEHELNLIVIECMLKCFCTVFKVCVSSVCHVCRPRWSGQGPAVPASTAWLRQVQAVRMAVGFEGPNAGEAMHRIHTMCQCNEPMQ
jgi:hypothetical protein